MATLDPTRAAFVQNEYRRSIFKDAYIKALFSNSEVFEINTNLSKGDADAMGEALLDALSTPNRIFTVIISGKVRSTDFTSGLPRYTATFPEFNLLGVAVKVVSAEIDYMKNEAALVVRT